LNFASCTLLQVIHPIDLQNEFEWIEDVNFDGELKKGVIESSLANFGVWEYGTTIQGKVLFPISNLDGCQEFKDEDFEAGSFDNLSVGN